MLRYISAILFCLALCGCANEHYRLYSVLDDAKDGQVVQLNGVDYSEKKSRTSKFNLLGMLGYVSLDNVMAYDATNKVFNRLTTGPTLIEVELINHNQFDPLVLSGISGELFIENEKITPIGIEMAYGTGTCNSRSKSSVSKDSQLMVKPRQFVCYFFSYGQYVSPKTNINFNFGAVQKQKTISELNLRLTPVVVKSSSH